MSKKHEEYESYNYEKKVEPGGGLLFQVRLDARHKNLLDRSTCDYETKS